MHIAIHLEAVHKPKALKAAARLGMQPQEFILHVMAPVWIFAAMNNDGSGDVTGLDDDVLSAITFGRCKSVTILVETGWLYLAAGKLEVPRWLEHEPYFAEKARDRQRKRAERLAKSVGSPTDVPRTSTGNPALEEKREEERRKEPATTSAGNFRADFLSLYPESPNTRFTTQAERDWHQLTDKQREQCRAAVQVYAAEVARWSKAERKFVLLPEKWLKGYGPEFKVTAETFRRESADAVKVVEEWYNEVVGGDIVPTQRFWRLDAEGRRVQSFKTRVEAEGK